MTALILGALLLSPHVDPPPPLPLLVNPYYPPAGGINCMEPCTHFGNGVEIQDWHYGNRMACNPVNIGCEFRIWNDHGSIGPLWCVESGGALLEPQIHDGQLVQFVGILHDLSGDEPLPWWNHMVTDTWEVTCDWQN